MTKCVVLLSLEKVQKEDHVAFLAGLLHNGGLCNIGVTNGICMCQDCFVIKNKVKIFFCHFLKYIGFHMKG